MCKIVQIEENNSRVFLFALSAGVSIGTLLAGLCSRVGMVISTGYGM
jgi:hypothetical protein